MRSTTTCPHCQTQFLVTDEQVRKTKGKVRCGECLNVFNALENLTPEEIHPEENRIEASNTATEQVIHEEVKIETQLNAPAISDNTQIFEQLKDSALDANLANIDHLPEKTASVTPTQTEFELDIIQESHDLIQHASFATQKNDETPLEVPVTQEDISKINAFDYKPEYQYYLDQKKTSRPTLLILGIGLILLAFSQAIFFFRHDIVNSFPSTYDFFVSVCKPLNCKASLPKNIDLFSIDDSDIEEDVNYKNVYLLSSTLSNHATYNQAYPNIEVTLTDTDDKPTLRRVFKPYEYLAANTAVEKGVMAGESIPINMSLLLNSIKPAGYRVLVTY